MDKSESSDKPQENNFLNVTGLEFPPTKPPKKDTVRSFENNTPLIENSLGVVVFPMLPLNF